MVTRRLLIPLLAAIYVVGSETAFSVYDDVLAFPQYEIVFSESYITSDEAQKLLQTEPAIISDPPVVESDSALLARFDNGNGDGIYRTQKEAGVGEIDHYKRLVLKDKSYLCSIPHVQKQSGNITEARPSAADQEKELARARSRGWELLQDMQGSPCLFFTTGWWSYSFCYNSQVKQFHSLPMGVNGVPPWPPTEDPTTPTYVLGRFHSQGSAQSTARGNDLIELQKQADTSYLVQRLEGGTSCDLTGKDRKIEIQFHCSPSMTDRIGWIKETATCAYLMIIYTPRLCNDVAFLPPTDTKAHIVACQEIVVPDDIADWQARKAKQSAPRFIDQGSPQRVWIGNVEVGAMMHVGREGKRVERGRVVLTPEERAEIVAIQRDGRVEGMSKADLKKLDLNPDDVDAFRKELQKLAGSKDWKIERLDDVNGNVQLRGVVATETGKKTEPKETNSQAKEEGSEEEYKGDV